MEINTKEDLLNILQGFQEKFDAMEVSETEVEETEVEETEVETEEKDEIDELLNF